MLNGGCGAGRGGERNFSDSGESSFQKPGQARPWIQGRTWKDSAQNLEVWVLHYISINLGQNHSSMGLPNLSNKGFEPVLVTMCNKSSRYLKQLSFVISYGFHGSGMQK